MRLTARKRGAVCEDVPWGLTGPMQLQLLGLQGQHTGETICHPTSFVRLSFTCPRDG